MTVRKLFPALLVAALAATPASLVAAAAQNCWNDCTIKATEWMNAGNHSYEEVAIYHEGCVAGCEGGN